MNQAVEHLKNRCSVRNFTPKPITDTQLESILCCAQMAPTSNHYQAYSIIQVCSTQKRTLLRAYAGNQDWVAHAPCVLLFCADLSRAKRHFPDVNPAAFETAEMFTIAVVDAALAAQSALAAAELMGLGGVIVGGIRNQMEEVSSLFALPELVCPLFLLCLGVPAEHNDVKPRLPREAVVHCDMYLMNGENSMIEEYDNTISAYYAARSNGEVQTTWTERCAKAMRKRPREEVGIFLQKAGFLLEALPKSQK